MKNLKILSLIISSMIITGCGGGGDASFEHQIVDITVKCTTTSPSIPTASDILTYQELYSGDKVIKKEVDTIVQFYTPIDKNTRVCLESGSAEIIRN